MADPLVNLSELVTISYNALPGPYFVKNDTIVAYDKFSQPMEVATFKMTNMAQVDTAIFLSMMTPATIRDIARQVEEMENIVMRYHYMRTHGVYEFKNLSGDGLDAAIDARRNEIYDED